MRTSYVVRFYHRVGWEEYAELGPTMEDVAHQRARELSIPFRDAEVRLVRRPDASASWEDGTIVEIHEYRYGKLISFNRVG